MHLRRQGAWLQNTGNNACCHTIRACGGKTKSHCNTIQLRRKAEHRSPWVPRVCGGCPIASSSARVSSPTASPKSPATRCKTGDVSTVTSETLPRTKFLQGDGEIEPCKRMSRFQLMSRTTQCAQM